MSVVICLGLTGCSKVSASDAVTCQFDGSLFKVDGQDVDMEVYGGYYGEFLRDGVQFEIHLEQVDDLSYAEFNYDQIITDDMTLYNKKAYCWSMYLGTQKIMYYPYSGNEKDGFYWIAMKGYQGMAEQQAYLYEWQLAEKLKMTEGQVIVECDDKVTFTSDADIVKVTKDYASISGMCNIKKQTKPECTQPYTVVQNEKETYTLYRYDSDAYTYYQYGDWLIQTVLGLPIEDYFTFH